MNDKGIRERASLWCSMQSYTEQHDLHENCHRCMTVYQAIRYALSAEFNEKHKDCVHEFVPQRKILEKALKENPEDWKNCLKCGLLNRVVKTCHYCGTMEPIAELVYAEVVSVDPEITVHDPKLRGRWRCRNDWDCDRRKRHKVGG